MSVKTLRYAIARAEHNADSTAETDAWLAWLRALRAELAGR
jgi:hypothetical protein